MLPTIPALVKGTKAGAAGTFVPVRCGPV